MALGPQYNREKIAQTMENYIDAVIQECRSEKVTINVSYIPGWNHSIFNNVLVYRYRNAGWKNVLYHNDPRDGNYIELSM